MGLTTVGESKVCTGCHTEKALSEFPRRADGRSQGTKSKCHECQAEYMRDYYEANKEKANQRSREWFQANRERQYESQVRWREENPEAHKVHKRRSHLKATFGLTIEDYAEMLEAQGGVCAVCKETCKSGRELAVDHDHTCCPGARSCGKCIRGLLCASCNTAAGAGQDNPEILRNLADYIEGRWAS